MKTKLLFFSFIVFMLAGCCQKAFVRPVYDGDTAWTNFKARKERASQRVVQGSAIVENWGADLYFGDDTINWTGLFLPCPCDSFTLPLQGDVKYSCPELEDGQSLQEQMYIYYAGTVSYGLASSSFYWIENAPYTANEEWYNEAFHQAVLASTNAQDSCEWTNECYDIPLYAICNNDTTVFRKLPAFCP